MEGMPRCSVVVQGPYDKQDKQLDKEKSDANDAEHLIINER